MSTEPLKTALEVSKHLRMSERWVRQQANESDMPHFRMGEKALRFRLSEVEAWLEARRCGRGKAVA